MFEHLLESSGDDSNKWSNIGFGEETGIIEISVHLIWSPDHGDTLVLLAAGDRRDPDKI